MATVAESYSGFKDHLEAKKEVSSIAMTMTLVSFSMLFATLLLGYAIYRITSEVWPPMGMERIHLLIPSLSTIMILLSSACFFLYEKNYLNEKKNQTKSWFIGSLIFGIAFVTFQFQFWSFLKASGILAGTSIFSSIIYAFTWIHVAHMFAGLVALLFLLPTLRLTNNKQVGIYESRISNIGKFWHFLGFIWLIMYISIFVL